MTANCRKSAPSKGDPAWSPRVRTRRTGTGPVPTGGNVVHNLVEGTEMFRPRTVGSILVIDRNVPLTMPPVKQDADRELA